MEVTSVSPSATSPTEGDDLCEIDGSNVAIHSVTLLISLCGLVGNGAAFWLFRKNLFIFHIYKLGFADFLFLLFTVPSALLFLVEDLSCTSILPLLYLSFLFQLSRVSCYWALLCVFPVGAGDLMWKLYDLSSYYDLPLWLCWLVHNIQSSAAFALFAVIPTVTINCPSHDQEHCRAALISMHTVVLLVFVVPMVISRTIDLIQTMRGFREQEPDRLEIATLLVVLLIFLLSLFNFLQQLGYIIVSSQISFLLTCIYSSIKPFIYFLDGRCWTLCSAGFRWLSQQRIFKWREENPFFLRRSLQKILDGVKETHCTINSHRLSVQRILDGLQRKPFSMKSLQRCLQGILEGLQESLHSIESSQFSLQKIIDGLEGKPFFMESHRLSLQKILDRLEENLSSIKSLRIFLRRICDGLEEKIPIRNDAPKDTGI